VLLPRLGRSLALPEPPGRDGEFEEEEDSQLRNLDSKSLGPGFGINAS
jgi:hypothetical protein